jgi:hypothetical protein
MRTIVFISLVAAGCASGSETIPATTTTTQPVVIDRGGGAISTITLTKQESAYTGQFTSAPQALWPAVQRVFRELELPVTSVDSTAHMITSTAGRIRRIDNKPVATYVECPGTAYGNAASGGAVYVTVQAQLLATATGSELRVSLQAKSISETGMNRGDCTSTGVLEARIANALRP